MMPRTFSRDHIVATDIQFERHIDSIASLWKHKNDTLDMARFCKISEAAAESILSSLQDGRYIQKQEEEWEAAEPK